MSSGGVALSGIGSVLGAGIQLRGYRKDVYDFLGLYPVLCYLIWLLRLVDSARADGVVGGFTSDSPYCIRASGGGG